MNNCSFSNENKYSFLAFKKGQFLVETFIAASVHVGRNHARK